MTPPKTVEERAKEFLNTHRTVNFNALVKLITEACADAYHRGLYDGFEKEVSKARQETLEEAAKVAENTPFHYLRSQSFEGLRLSIADAIRSLGKVKP